MKLVAALGPDELGPRSVARTARIAASIGIRAAAGSKHGPAARGCQLAARAPGDGAGRERTICPSSSLYTRGGESVVVPPAGQPAGVTRDEACGVDLGGAGRVDAAERGCVGSEDAGDAPLVRDAVQVASVTWLGMAGLVGLGARRRSRRRSVSHAST